MGKINKPPNLPNFSCTQNIPNFIYEEALRVALLACLLCGKRPNECVCASILLNGNN